MILLLFTTLTTLIFASNPTAIDYYESGDIQSAKTLFEATSNLDAMDYYYMGLIDLKEGNKKAAIEKFNKGLQIDPENSYNSVGLATIQMAEDEDSANKTLKSISKDRKYKKDDHMLVAIAAAYAYNNNTSKKEYYLNRAKKYNDNTALPYLFEGNLFMEKGDGNQAAVNFEQALYFDPNSKYALVKLAQLYVGTRKSIAFDYLDKATTLDPNYEYAWKTKANLRYNNGFYPEAQSAFESYMNILTKPMPKDYQTYAEILYFNKEYDKTLVALAKAEDNVVTNRLKMYCLYNLNKYEEACPIAKDLVTNSKKEDLIWQDYSYFADMLYKDNKFAEASVAYEQAYLADTTRTDAMKDIARAADRAGEYDKAISYYQKTLDSKAASISLADVYSLGATYYSAGTDTTVVKDLAKRTEYLKKADETFAKQTELFPEHYLGYIMRARVNSALDPKTTEGLAESHYLKALEVMAADTSDEYKNETSEAYQYLGYLYLQKDNYPKSLEYWEKVKEITPDNASAEQAIKFLSKAVKKK